MRFWYLSLTRKVVLNWARCLSHWWIQRGNRPTHTPGNYKLLYVFFEILVQTPRGPIAFPIASRVRSPYGPL